MIDATLLSKKGQTHRLAEVLPTHQLTRSSNPFHPRSSPVHLSCFYLCLSSTFSASLPRSSLLLTLILPLPSHPPPLFLLLYIPRSSRRRRRERRETLGGDGTEGDKGKRAVPGLVCLGEKRASERVCLHFVFHIPACWTSTPLGLMLSVGKHRSMLYVTMS